MLYAARKAEAQRARKVDDWGRVWLIGQRGGSLFLRFMTGQVTPVPDLAAIPPLDHCCPLPTAESVAAINFGFGRFDAEALKKHCRGPRTILQKAILYPLSLVFDAHVDRMCASLILLLI
jgi:hypothetical protein